MTNAIFSALLHAVSEWYRTIRFGWDVVELAIYSFFALIHTFRMLQILCGFLNCIFLTSNTDGRQSFLHFHTLTFQLIEKFDFLCGWCQTSVTFHYFIFPWGEPINCTFTDSYSLNIIVFSFFILLQKNFVSLLFDTPRNHPPSTSSNMFNLPNRFARFRMQNNNDPNHTVDF